MSCSLTAEAQFGFGRHATLPDGAGKALVEGTCGNCHYTDQNRQT